MNPPPTFEQSTRFENCSKALLRITRATVLLVSHDSRVFCDNVVTDTIARRGGGPLGCAIPAATRTGKKKTRSADEARPHAAPTNGEEGRQGRVVPRTFHAAAFGRKLGFKPGQGARNQCRRAFKALEKVEGRPGSARGLADPRALLQPGRGRRNRANCMNRYGRHRRRTHRTPKALGGNSRRGRGAHGGA